MRWGWFILLLLASPAGATHATQALAYLEPYATEPSLAPLVAEAAVSAGLDPAAWPEAHPVLDRIHVPANGSLLPMLRPMHALALAGRLNQTHPDVVRLWSFHDGVQFGSRDAFNDDVWTLRVLLAVGVDASDARIQSSLDDLARRENATGGWGWSVAARPEVDTTAMVLAAYHAAGRELPSTAIAFIARLQSPSGGYPLNAGGLANCDSTVWALNALSLAGQEVPANATQFLSDLRNIDGGYAFVPGTQSDAFCTAELVPWMHALDHPVEAVTPSRSTGSGLSPGRQSASVSWFLIAVITAGVAVAARKRL